MSVPGIDQLKELQPPPPLVSYWPQTWGWLVLAVLLVVALCAWAFWRYRRWRRDRYRREALAQLDELSRSLDDPRQRLPALRQLPALMKRVALSMQAGEGAAPLAGDDWQAYLQRHSAAALPAGLGRHLALLAYAPDERIEKLEQSEARAWLAACRKWVEVHRVAA
ncbi:DUF4381 domain-containing protein [Pseudomonas sp. PDNC002]|uniref:DUF4381 domain-containing protein n=1 Tax=Pseudomonas sp. PDNC002 TaxID=2811422 RepID=UPI0019648AFE|nr:DUF4381 domain-containing protein [Pseudomonas sp. PDNC002]QRY77679.1 DUF4381 domain-containing protein [Pseudomonas sp. PDNC002]